MACDALVTPAIHASIFIDGVWSSDGMDRRAGTSPVTGQRIGSYAVATPVQAAAAITAARAATSLWGSTTVFERAHALERIISAVERRADRLATLLTYEQGKPRATESAGEVQETIEHLRIAAEAARRLEGSIAPSADPAKRNFIYRVPRGVVVAIQPWNYPLAMAAQQIAPALAAGNTVVMLPAPTTSLIASEFAQCIAEADLPNGVFNFLTGDGSVVGNALTSDPRADVVVFTGSTATGGLISANAQSRAKLLELGGNGPMVILEDADIERAAAGVLASGVLNAGQACTAAELVLVHDSVYNEFAACLVEMVSREVVLGDPFDPDTTMGPLHNEPTAAKVDDHVEDAVALGATILVGGQREDGHPTNLYWPPTVIADVTGGMKISRTETFGPVLPLQRIASETVAHEVIDQSAYGLASSVYTRDIARGLRFAERVSTGMVNINEQSVWTEVHLPFGGRSGKGSGVGRVQGRYPLEDIFTETKTIILHLDS